MKKFIVCFFVKVMILGSMPLMAQEEREPLEWTPDTVERLAYANVFEALR